MVKKSVMRCCCHGNERCHCVLLLPQEKSLLVFVEETVVRDEMLSQDQDFMLVHDKLQKFKEGKVMVTTPP